MDSTSRTRYLVWNFQKSNFCFLKSTVRPIAVQICGLVGWKLAGFCEKIAFQKIKTLSFGRVQDAMQQYGLAIQLQSMFTMCAAVLLETCVPSVANWQFYVTAAEMWAWLMSFPGPAFDYLDAPVVRVTGADVPTPYAQLLEDGALPSINDIVLSVKKILHGKSSIARYWRIRSAVTSCWSVQTSLRSLQPPACFIRQLRVVDGASVRYCVCRIFGKLNAVQRATSEFVFGKFLNPHCFLLKKSKETSNSSSESSGNLLPLLGMHSVVWQRLAHTCAGRFFSSKQFQNYTRISLTVFFKM